MTLRSQNGWPVDPSTAKNYLVPGTTVTLRLATPDVAVALLWVASYFNTYIEPISTRHGVKGFDIPDDWSEAIRDVRGSSQTWSNHASATAIDLNATRHPRGVPISHTFSRVQISHCHDIESLSGGVIRWGGSYVYAPPDGMHFEINKSSASVALFAAKIKAGKVPGSWVGFPGAAPAPTTPVFGEGDDMALLISEADNAAVFETNNVTCRWVFDKDDLNRAQGFNAAVGVKNPTHVYEVASGSVKAGRYGVLVGKVPAGYEGMPRIATINAPGSVAA